MHDDPLAGRGSRLHDEVGATAGPPPDLEQGHRRRTTRHVGTVAGAVALVAVGLLVVPALLDGLDGPTLDPVAPTEESAPPDELTGNVEVHDLDLGVEVPVRLLAVRFNSPSLATIDLDPGRAALHPPGAHGLPGDAISGALVTSEGAIVVWQDDTVRMFTDRLDEPSFVYTPDEMINVAGMAPAFRVLPTPDGRALWVVQIGSCCPGEIDGLAELVGLPTGQVLTTVELPPSTFPAGYLGEDLLLNSEDLRPAGADGDAGWVTDPGSLHVLRLTPEGKLSDLTDGHAIATSGRTVLIRSCNIDVADADCNLHLLNTDTGQRRPIGSDVGTLGTAAGPAVPGDFSPWNVVAPDGRILISATHDTTGNELVASRLLVLDPDSAELAEIARYDRSPPPAAWDREGRYIVIADGPDLTIIDPTSGATIHLDGIVPEDHTIVGIG